MSIHTVILAFPIIIRPESINNCAMTEFLLALAPTNAHDPAVLLIPRLDAVMKLSYIATQPV